MAVNVSGSVFASILYDHAQSKGHQVGFLTGQVVSHMKDTISDSQINNYEVETKICIYGSVACHRDRLFYDEKGEILVDNLPEHGKNIVGWYSFRRCTTLRPSIKERIVHENLLKFLKHDQSHFMFLLCTSHVSKNQSTHSFDHSFSCLQNSMYGVENCKSFRRKPVTIINLGDTTHQEYRNLPSHTVSNNQGAYSLVIEQQEDTFLDAQGNMEVRQIQSLNGALRRKLEEISKKVVTSETKLSVLEEEIQRYRKEVRLKLLEKEQKQSSVPVPNLSVPKKPSVDDILSMDTNDGLGEPGLAPENTPKIQVTGVKNESQSVNMKDNSKGKSSVKSEIKLTSPASLHNRSNSMSNDKSFIPDSINPSDIIHSRSKSADLPDKKVKGSVKAMNDKDPFSFVSSVMAQSKHGDEQIKRGKDTAKYERSVPSSSVPMETDFNQRSTRQQSKNADALKEAAKGIKLSTRKQVKTNSNSIAKETDPETNGKMDVDSDTDTNLKSKSNLIGSSCSQEVGKTENSQSEDLSQDTYDMEVSSSPVY